ncbi:MAG: hypothetical protein ACJAR2_000664 [Ilumatobacter sp.]
MQQSATGSDDPILQCDCSGYGRARRAPNLTARHTRCNKPFIAIQQATQTLPTLHTEGLNNAGVTYQQDAEDCISPAYGYVHRMFLLTFGAANVLSLALHPVLSTLCGQRCGSPLLFLMLTCP